MDGRTLTLKHGEAAEPLDGDTHTIDPADAASAIERLTIFAFDDVAEADAFIGIALAGIFTRATIGSLLANRIYRDRIDCPDEA